MINTNEFIKTQEEKDILKNIRKEENKIDAIEIVKTLSFILTACKSRLYVDETVTRLNNDKVFKNFIKFMPKSSYLYSYAVFNNELSDEYHESVNVRIDKDVLLHAQLKTIYNRYDDTYLYIMTTNTIIKNKELDGKIVNLERIISQLNLNYDVNQVQEVEIESRRRK